MISRRLGAFLVLSNIVLISLLALMGFTRQDGHYRELSVERLNIVGANGKPVIAISNKSMIAGPVVGGKSYPASASDGRENMAGLIFFNEEGDEMGGLVFNSFKLPNGRYAGVGHLSFDRYRDNQVLNLEYLENKNSVQSGLTLYDRQANGKFADAFSMINEYAEATPERQKEIEAALGAMKSNGDLGAERMFLGSKNQVAQIVLNDSKGKCRARLFVDKSDNAALEFYDLKGNLISKFPK